MTTPKPINPWSYKPWWCQPWSILLTGIALITGSWLLLHNLWVSSLVTLPVLGWWFLFLVLWPQAMRESDLLDAEVSSEP